MDESIYPGKGYRKMIAIKLGIIIVFVILLESLIVYEYLRSQELGFLLVISWLPFSVGAIFLLSIANDSFKYYVALRLGDRLFLKKIFWFGNRVIPYQDILSVKKIKNNRMTLRRYSIIGCAEDDAIEIEFTGGTARIVCNGLSDDKINELVAKITKKVGPMKNAST